jgi:hypothetical protein
MHEEDLEIAIEALKKIRDFDHAEGCNSMAPVYECGCFDKSQADIAAEALKKIDS